MDANDQGWKPDWLVDAGEYSGAVPVTLRGKFITFEGIDGAGKSTHIPAVARWLRARGLDVVVTREPGGTPLGEKLRALLLSETMHLDTETLMMFAARCEHVLTSALQREREHDQPVRHRGGDDRGRLIGPAEDSG